MFKRWLAVLGAVVLLVCTSPLLWGGGDGGDENPWHSATGGSGGAGGTTVRSETNAQTSYPFTRIYIVHPAPMGGFYIIRVNLSGDASVKTGNGVKKVEN